MVKLSYLKAILFLIFLLNFSLFSAESQPTGTLCVTYQTGPAAERLDRIRFTLQQENHEPQMYPKGAAFATNENGQTHTVVIDYLAAGKYSLHFIVPNSDGLFEEVPSREVTISSGEILKIDQLIKPRYASLRAKVKLAQGAQPFSEQPLLTLTDSRGNVRAQSTAGNLSVHYLIPGTYTLVFEEIPFYVPPSPLQLNIEPNEEVGPLIGTYFDIHDPHAPEHKSAKTSSKKTSLEIAQEDSSNASTIQHPAPHNGYLTIRSNYPNARWVIYHNDLQIYVGQGSQTNLPISPGEHYRLRVEDVDGFQQRSTLPKSFTIHPGEKIVGEIHYERTYGHLIINASVPDGEAVNLTIIGPEGVTPIQAALTGVEGKLSWESEKLPTGEYEISFTTRGNIVPPPPQIVTVRANKYVSITPEFSQPRSLVVTSNISESVFELKQESSGISRKGGGHGFTFKKLTPGLYTLVFSTTEPQVYIPPPPVKIVINEYQDSEYKAAYTKAGKLIINTNVDQAPVTIRELDGEKNEIQKQINSKHQVFYLPEGTYQVVFQPVEGSKTSPPPPVEVTVSIQEPAHISVNYENRNAVKESKNEGQLTVMSNIPGAKFSLRKVNDAPGKISGRYKGPHNILSLLPNVKYEIDFEDVNQYQTPNAVQVVLKGGEEKTIYMTYVPKQVWLPVYAGEAIIGDPFNDGKENERPSKIVEVSAFAINAYEVTNEQYALWLNQALSNGKITYKTETSSLGLVLDLEGHLLCKTWDADPFSQISFSSTTNKSSSFEALPGKENHPVIDVTWYGAQAYCKDNLCRLLTEAEWEKAAGMALPIPGKPMKKYKYGFSRDTIDKTWANYKDNDVPIDKFQVLTTPVGFYNGINVLPLTIGETKQTRTNSAKSPVGAYDMSGNVWEWVSDWYDANYRNKMQSVDPQGPETGTEKVAKGGCYDSLAAGVRVSERMALPPDHADPYTGFRCCQ